MNRLIFYYGAMNAGKSLELLAFAAKLRNKGINYVVMKPSTDTRDGSFISSRPLNEKLPCYMWSPGNKLNISTKIRYVLVDEAQFLTTEQVDQLANVVDNPDLNCNVICYGLRTDFQTKLFEGSKRLFELADELHEIEDVDAEGDKIIINARIANGKVTLQGPQVEIGAEDKYQSMSRKEFFFRVKERLFSSVVIND